MLSQKLCISDGALGFWKSLRQVYPTAKHQRCCDYKTANVLDKMPKSIQLSAKSLIYDIYRAESEKDALAAYTCFQEQYQAKYSKTFEDMVKFESSLFTFYHYPAKHWQHIRSTNPIESAFATVRLRTAKTRGQGSMVTTLAMVFKLAERASLMWRKLTANQLIGKVLQVIKFVNGIEETLPAKQA
jgi:putative transposase